MTEPEEEYRKRNEELYDVEAENFVRVSTKLREAKEQKHSKNAIDFWKTNQRVTIKHMKLLDSRLAGVGEP